MKHSLKIGISFGLTSAIITTLGLMIGLESGTHSKLVVIGGVLIIAIADAMSDALGIHISEESEKKHASKEVWTSTLATFFSKFLFALTFLVPVLLLELKIAVLVNIVWGLSILTLISYKISTENKWKVILEHLLITVLVIIISHYTGAWIASIFT